MKALVLLLLIIAMASAAPTTKLDASTAVNDFSWTLLRSLDSPSDNQFFSAPSIATAFAMLAAGASGNTLQQLSATFRHEMIKGNVHEQFGKLLSHLNGRSSKDLDLTVANKIYVANDIKLKDEFSHTLTTSYQAAVELANFRQFAAKVTNDINAWVDKETRGMIQKLFEEPLSPSTVMALLNAIYFKGDLVDCEIY